MKNDDSYFTLLIKQAFLDISKKTLKAKKTQAEKKLKQIFEKLMQIIQKTQKFANLKLIFLLRKVLKLIFAQKFDKNMSKLKFFY